MTDFNPEELLHVAVEGSNSTKTIPVPLGEWEATVGKPAFRQVQIKKEVGKGKAENS